MWSEVSCGIRELAGLGAESPKELILGLLEEEYYDSGGFNFSQVLFSDHLTNDGKPTKKYGEKLAKYIRDNDLGPVIETRAIKNRNTGNKIKTWIWNVNNTRKVCKTVGWKKSQRYHHDWF